MSAIPDCRRHEATVAVVDVPREAHFLISPTKQNGPADVKSAGPFRSPCAAILRLRVGIRGVASELHDCEFRLAHIAQRAAPVFRDIGEARARRDTAFRQTFLFVVDPAANQADPALVLNNDFAHDTLFLQFATTIRAVRPFLGRAATRNITGI